MTRILKSLFLTVLIAAAVMPVAAQPQRGNRGGDREQMQQLRDVPPEVRSEAHIAVFNKYLELSENQERQIREVDAQFAEKGAALRGAPMRGQRKMMQMGDLRNEHQQAIHDILTKDQYSVYLEQKEAIQFEIRQRLKAFTDDGNK